MNPHLLIDAIVRQTTVLIAQLATAAGTRAPLAHVAADVFGSLVEELKDQGLGSKVIADMFGLALRTYHNRVRRYAESATDRGVSLWEAVLTHVRDRGVVTRGEVLKRFHADDEATVRAVLKDLVDNGLLFRSGRADHTTFRAAEASELPTTNGSDAASAHFAWVLLHQRGAMTAAEVAAGLGLKDELVNRALDQLVEQGRVQASSAEAGGAPIYRVEDCVISYGDGQGWEAALFDHYQAMVAAIVSKVRGGTTVARRDDHTGGSTYHFDLHPGHPAEQKVPSLLGDLRDRATEIRAEVDAHRQEHERGYRLVFYAGQHLIRSDEDEREVET